MGEALAAPASPEHAPASGPVAFGRGLSGVDVLRLQGSAGNAAVSRMLAERRLAREAESGDEAEEESPAAVAVAEPELEEEEESESEEQEDAGEEPPERAEPEESASAPGEEQEDEEEEGGGPIEGMPPQTGEPESMAEEGAEPEADGEHEEAEGGVVARAATATATGRGGASATASAKKGPRGVGSKVGIVAEFGREKAKLRERASTNSRIVTELPFNTRVFITDAVKGGWYEVTLDNGLYGYVSRALIKTNLPEPTSRLHRIEADEFAIDLAQRLYGHRVKPGLDLRFFVNVLEYVNRGSGKRGIYQPDPNDKSRGAWKKIRTRANYMIWVPSGDFAESLKGRVSTGSLTGGAWARTREVIEKVENFAIGGAAFVAGLLTGAGSAIRDLLVGAAQLVSGVWKVLKSLFEGNILRDARRLWDAVTHLNVREIADSWVSRFTEKWTAKDIWDRWKFRGWVAGYAIAEIAMTILSGAGTLAVKLAGKAGKVASKLMGAVRGFTGKLGSVKLPKAVDKVVKSRLMGRQLVSLGLKRSYVRKLDDAERQAAVDALNRWNVSEGGQSQGVTHIIDYAKGGGGAAKDKRLDNLEQYHGAGPFDIKDGSLIPDVTNALRGLIHGGTTKRKDIGKKTIYWVPRTGVPLPPSNSAKGTIIITYDQKFSTFFEGNYRSWTKKT